MQNLKSVIDEQNKALTSIGKDISTQILARITELTKEQGLELPSGYNPTNALKLAQIKLSEQVDKNNQPVLSVCTPASICSCLMKMLIRGLEPEGQCYFIPYGKELTFIPSVDGNIALAKRLDSKIANVTAMCIYDGESYDLDVVKGEYVVVKHKPDAKAINEGKIIALYANCWDEQGNLLYSDYKSFNDIQHSWLGLTGTSQTAFQKRFPAEAGKRTIINHMLKHIIKSAVSTSNNKALKSEILASNDNDDEIEEQFATTSEPEALPEPATVAQPTTTEEPAGDDF